LDNKLKKTGDDNPCSDCQVCALHSKDDPHKPR
jgi:hypothetical protein